MILELFIFDEYFLRARIDVLKCYTFVNALTFCNWVNKTLFFLSCMAFM